MLNHDQALINQTPKDINRHFSRLQNHSALRHYEQHGEGKLIKKTSSMQRISSIPAMMSISTDLKAYGMQNAHQQKSLFHGHGQEHHMQGPNISVDYSSHKIEVVKNSRNAA